MNFFLVNIVSIIPKIIDISFSSILAIKRTFSKYLFAFKINYNTIEMGASAVPLYNGNISETEWRTTNTDNSLHWYRYDYDALNRLKKATDNLGKLNETINYDKNGNITDLVRLGHIVGGTTVPNINNSQHFGTMDNLVYTYSANSNKLLKVADSANKTYGFRDGTNTGDDYAYDANRNMTRDLNKGIATLAANGIAYNFLNLPIEVKFDNSNTRKINYNPFGLEHRGYNYVVDRADKVSQIQRIKVSIAIIIANPFNCLD